MKKLFTLLLLVLALPSYGAVSDEEFNQLKAGIEMLLERVNALEAENKALKVESSNIEREVNLAREDVVRVESSVKSSSAAKESPVSLSGDFRYRYEGIEKEGSADRSRNRIRARVDVTAELADDVEVGVGLATGGDDPVSTNQTLGGGGSTKDVKLNLAYAKWTARPGLNVVAGKFNNIWYRPAKNELLWDSDLTPEGFAVTYDNGALFAQSSLNWLESDSAKNNNRFLWGAQTGIKTSFGGSKLTAGVGYYDLDVKGLSVYFGENDDFFGNTFTCTDFATLAGCTYVYSYQNAEMFASLTTSIADLPVELYANYTKNLDADQFDTGWLAGFKIGKARNLGSWEFGYTYEDLDADAVFGLTTNSDFGGGGTDARGHILKGAMGINPQWKVGFTYFLNDTGGNRGIEKSYKRLQLDTQFTF